VKVLEWNVHGLHTDKFSIQNGSIVTRAQRERVLLLIDPQSVGKNWIINVERSRDLQVSRHSCFPLLDSVCNHLHHHHQRALDSIHRRSCFGNDMMDYINVRPKADE